MKNLLIIYFAFIFFILPATGYAYEPGDLRISLLEGDVQIRTEDTSEWVPASINMPLRDGDRIWAPEAGRIELQLRDGTILRLDENSSLEILTVEKDSFQVYLGLGHAYVNFKGVRDSLIQMDTPVSSIRAYDRSKFRVDTAEDGGTDISVFKGAVYAENRNGKTRVGSGKTLSLREDNYAELSALGPSDEWERWNTERDRKTGERRYSYRYLPEELEGYSNDLDENGKWVHLSEYGYVWTPTVIVSADWSPYRIGRWVWIGGDYVWISYEPWGWVPYHYGRWTFVVSVGWCWVPPARGAVYWGPGYVGWVQTPTYVAWVPLAPGEIYYGYGYYGPHSVNIININIFKTEIINVYKNVHIKNAITVIHNDTFTTGRPVGLKVIENPFLKGRINIGRPDIKPQRPTIMPVLKEIPHVKQPPQKIRDVRVKELKIERPLVKKPNVPVMRPGLPQKTMPLKTFEEPKRKDSEPQRELKPVAPQKQIQPYQKQQKQEQKKDEEIRRPGLPQRTEPLKTYKEPKIKAPETLKEKKAVPQQIQPYERQQKTVREPAKTQKEIRKPAEEKQKGLSVPPSKPEKKSLKSEKKEDEKQ